MGSLNPVYLTEEDIVDISTFLDLDRDYCRKRILNYKTEEMAEAWDRAAPKTEEDIRRFYQTTDLYIWEQLQTHASAERRECVGKMIDFLLQKYPPSSYPRVLDYGAGIGTDVITFAQRGYEVFFADVSGLISDFARHRLKRRNLKATFIPVESGIPENIGQFDIIICLEVLEHLPDPIKVLRLFYKSLSPKGVMAITTTPTDFGGKVPLHLPSTFPTLGKHWYLTLDRIGLDSLGDNLYRKASGAKGILKKLRYFFWKITGLYITHLPRR